MSTAGKIRDLKRSHPDRPLILVGWGVAAAINCTIAAMDQALSASSSVLEAMAPPQVGGSGGNPNMQSNNGNGGIKACICLGFPLYTLDGIRGEPDDPLLDMRTSTLFLIGENATQTRADAYNLLTRFLEIVIALLRHNMNNLISPTCTN